MIFNFWRPYPLLRPKEDGWYFCSVTEGKRGVIELYYSTHNGGGWFDLRRQNVFDGYKVYKSGREPLDYNRVFTDTLCERIDILAWKRLPKPCFWRKDKREE